MSRELDAAVRSFADSNTASLNEIPATKQIIATITTVTTGAAKDGNALVKVTWRGREFPLNGYDRTYTPVVGHRVICSLIDSQLFHVSSPVGFP